MRTTWTIMIIRSQNGGCQSSYIKSMTEDLFMLIRGSSFSCHSVHFQDVLAPVLCFLIILQYIFYMDVELFILWLFIVFTVCSAVLGTVNVAFWLYVMGSHNPSELWKSLISFFPLQEPREKSLSCFFQGKIPIFSVWLGCLQAKDICGHCLTFFI